MTGAVRLLNLARLREHPLGTVLTVVAIGAGVALFVAVLVARASIDNAVRSFGRDQAGPASASTTADSTPMSRGNRCQIPKLEVTGAICGTHRLKLTNVEPIASGQDCDR